MLLLKIFIGLIGISIVVFIHELGHFTFAKLFKVEVETFSVGMGPRLFGFKYKETDYRLSALPLGGYCKLKGHDDLARTMGEKGEAFEPEPGSFYYISAWKRIIISFAGPGFNFLSAFLIFFVLFQVGIINFKTVIDVVDFPDGQIAPAKLAGLEFGDEITHVNGKAIHSFYDIVIAVNSEDEEIGLSVLRNNERLELNLVPAFIEETQSKMIGVISLITLGQVPAKTGASKSGLQKGDTLYLINDEKITNFSNQFRDYYDMDKAAPTLTILRDNELITIKTERKLDNKGFVDYFFGSQGVPSYIKINKLSFGKATELALTQPFAMMKENFVGLYSIFTGQNKDKYNKDDLQGPISIIGGIGANFVELGQDSIAVAVYNLFFTLALISLILGIMNLLPIPALDGGLILISLAEIIMRKRPSVKALMRYQMIGLFIILLLTIFILKNDISNIINGRGF